MHKKHKVINMNTKEVAEKTGVAERTVIKYACILKIKYYGEGRRKIYDWKESDIKKLIQSKKLVGRPTKENPVRPRKSTRKPLQYI